MDSINFAFIVPGDGYDDDCHRCSELWEESEKRPEDTRRIRSAHNDCHGWTHCDIDCCGPCPYCGYCDGLDEEEWNYNKDTGQMEKDDPEYSESKSRDNTEYTDADWKQDSKYD